ncbi:type II secretion system F family protein [Paludisphaera rhizosphaerae]|uniref:type II secretion system F family protein n=1 Tax=Paludisphaera rhizosphaerae TaxID=2711216 RepID=UPI0013ECECD5|nr:type II secretion system F family protein [Paludisphaera rhizosphaerae]
MDQETIVLLAVFGAVAGVALLAGTVFSQKRGKLAGRLDELSGRGRRADEEKPETVAKIAKAALPKLGKVIVPEDEAERNRLANRLVLAGLYNRQAIYLFLGVKLSIMLAAMVVGAGLTLTGAAPPDRAMGAALGLFLVGMIGPSFWLDKRRNGRQLKLRRAMPDALDVLIICLEGGLSFQAALKKVADEIGTAHPMLGGELRIVDREIQLGRTAGEAITHFAERTGLEEAASMATVIGQSERFGASLVKSLKAHSDTLRERRKQIAEERAQKAATKILFPTLFCIFPAIFVILLAPAVFQMMKSLGSTPADQAPPAAASVASGG